MDRIECPLCGSGDTKSILSYTADNYSFNLCGSCTGIFADPMKPADKEWYERSEWYIFPKEADKELKWYEKVLLEDHHLYKGKKSLNIGCGRNDFLRRLQDSGCTVTGLDINDSIIDFTKNVLGIEDAYSSDVSDFIRDFKGEKFDIIIFFEVLEHLQNPREFISGLQNILKEDGYLVFSVPNRVRLASSRDIWDYPPHHLTRWDVKSINNFLEVNGYFIKQIKTSPINADNLVKLMKSIFVTESIEETMRLIDDNKSSNRRATAFAFNTLFKLKMSLYRAAEIIAGCIIKNRGPHIYTIAGVKKEK